MDIQIKAKLQAYTKGLVFPEAPNEVGQYARVVYLENGEYHYKWEKVFIPEPEDITTTITSNDGSIEIVETSVGNKKNYDLSVVGEQKEWTGNMSELQPALEQDYDTYYVIEDNEPQVYLNGGTAYNDNEDFGEITEEISCGGANSVAEDIYTPLNAQGDWK